MSSTKVCTAHVPGVIKDGVVKCQGCKEELEPCGCTQGDEDPERYCRDCRGTGWVRTQ